MEDCLFYDSAKANNLSEYDIYSNLSVEWLEEEYYKITQKTTGYGYCSPLNLSLPKTIVIECEVGNIPQGNQNSQLRIGAYNPNNNNKGVGAKLTRMPGVGVYDMSVVEGTAGKTYEAWSPLQTKDISIITGEWYILKIIIDESNVQGLLSRSDGSEVVSVAGFFSSSILGGTGNELYIEHCYSSGACVGIRNIKVKPNI